MTLESRENECQLSRNKQFEKDYKTSLRKALPQILAVSVKNVLLIGFGMTLGYPTILIPSLSGEDGEETILLNSEQISWIGSLNLICVPVGCLLSGAITSSVGRKKAMQMVNIPFFVAWLIFRFSQDVWHVYLALCMTGLSGGLLEAPVLTYVAEITQPHLRGLLSATSTFSIILGILIEFSLATSLSWRNAAVASSVLPIISFSLLFFVPESPYWLITKRRIEEAQTSLAWLRGWTKKENIQHEFQDLCKAAGNQQEAKQTYRENMKNFIKKNFLWPFGLVSFTFFMGHFSGMTTLQTYAIQIFSLVRAPINVYYAAVILGIAELFGCITCVVLIHYVGKRLLTFTSLIGNGLCLMLVGIFANYFHLNYFFVANKESVIENGNSSTITDDIKYTEIDHYSWIPTVFLVASAFLTHTGIRILPWILTGEVYSKETRAIASGLSSAMGYIFGFLSNKLFLKMVSGLTLAGTFWFYCSLNVLATIILYFALPETEGKSLYEITDHFNGIVKMDNKIRRKRKTNVTGKTNDAFSGKLDDVDDEKIESKL